MLRQELVDLDQAVHFQRFARGLLGELVSAVAGANGDGQGVQAGELYELGSLRGIGEVAQAVEPGAVAVFDAAQTTDFAFHRDPLGMGHLHHFARGLDVVVKAGGRLAIRHQRPIHHDAGEAQFDGGLAGLHAVAVVQVKHQGNFRIEFRRRQHEVIKDICPANIGALRGWPERSPAIWFREQLP